MNKVTRTLVMTGMAIAASAAIGVGPASAASAAPSSPSVSPSASQDAKFKDKSKVIDYYRSVFACHKVGNIGEWRNRWDDHRCVRVRFGFHRGWYALIARWEHHRHNWGGGDSNWGNDNGGNSNWGDGDGGNSNWGDGNGSHFGSNDPRDQKKH
jgi:hypothetical protein